MKCNVSRFTYLFICGITFLFLSSCGSDKSDDPEPTPIPSLTVSPQNVTTFNSEGGTSKLDLSANNTWEAVIENKASEWISVSPSNGNSGNHTITISVTKNSTNENRTGNIVFKSGNLSKSIAVSQSQNNVLEISQKTYNVPAEASKMEIPVTSNVDLEATTSEEWVHITSSRAIQTKSILVSIDENNTGKQRSASISIKGKDLTETVTIIQEANTSSSGDIEDMPIEIL